jgi:hypothetical protein
MQMKSKQALKYVTILTNRRWEPESQRHDVK